MIILENRLNVKMKVKKKYLCGAFASKKSMGKYSNKIHLFN